jgi:hypothetical protein
MRYVNAYEVTLGYGGPEEGGWYYDVGDPLASVPIPDAKNKDGRVEQNDEQAIETIKQLTTLLGPDFDHRPAKHSVSPDAGDLVFKVEDRVAQPFPESTPRYE